MEAVLIFSGRCKLAFRHQKCQNSGSFSCASRLWAACARPSARPEREDVPIV